MPILTVRQSARFASPHGLPVLTVCQSSRFASPRGSPVLTVCPTQFATPHGSPACLLLVFTNHYDLPIGRDPGNIINHKDHSYKSDLILCTKWCAARPLPLSLSSIARWRS